MYKVSKQGVRSQTTNTLNRQVDNISHGGKQPSDRKITFSFIVAYQCRRMPPKPGKVPYNDAFTVDDFIL